MSDQHLLNSIRLLRRTVKAHLNAELIAAYSFEATLHGDMASYCCAQDIEQMESMSEMDLLEESPIYQKLCNEAERRQLEVVYD